MLTNDQVMVVDQYAKKYGVELNVCLAFMSVETNYNLGTVVGNRLRPIIRWEGDYFWKFCPPALRPRGVALKLTTANGGKVPNPASQDARYIMLENGKTVDTTAAISACSWALGQVMGAHWKWLGFKSALDFETMAWSGFSGQLAIMFAFMDKSGIIPHMQRHDWSAMARIWNGPAYATNKYDVKMRTEYERLTGSPSPMPASAGMLRQGSKGAAVRDLQALLVRAGFSLTVDGDFGASTERAIRTWQKQQGLDIDGVAGPKTMETLQRLKTTPTEKPGMAKLVDIPQVKQAVLAGAGGFAGLGAIKDQVQDARAQLMEYVSYPVIQNLVTVLGYIAAAAVVGGLAYGAYGWWKQRHTVVGVEQK